MGCRTVTSWKKAAVKLKMSERFPCFGEHVEAVGKPAPSGETAKERKLSRDNGRYLTQKKAWYGGLRNRLGEIGVAQLCGNGKREEQSESAYPRAGTCV